MLGQFNNITLEKAQNIITKRYFLEESILRKKGMPNPIIVSIIFTIVLLLVSLVSALNGNQITNISTYAWIFIIPINFSPLFLKLIIKNKHLTLYKNSLSMYSVFSYIGFLLVIVLIVFPSRYLLGKKEMGLFFLFLLFVVLMLWIIFYTFKMILSDVYSKYGLSVTKTKFSIWYRKIFLWVLIAGIGLAYLFRNIPGSHGSTAPQWLQYLGIMGGIVIFILAPFYLIRDDIIKGLLIRKYYNEFREVYETKKEDGISGK